MFSLILGHYKCNLLLLFFTILSLFPSKFCFFCFHFHYFHCSVFSLFFTLDRRLYFRATYWQYNGTKIWHMKVVWNLFALRIWVNEVFCISLLAFQAATFGREVGVFVTWRTSGSTYRIPGNVLHRSAFLFIPKTEFQSNSSRFHDIPC